MKSPKSRSNLLIALMLVCTFSYHHAFADTIAIIGTGRVANALGPSFAELGHTIIYGSRDPAQEKVKELLARTGSSARATSAFAAAEAGQIVVVAIPWHVVETVFKDLGDLSGKIIIDPTNPFTGREAKKPVHALNYQTSMAEIIQDLQPDARVVKAFNTLAAATMADPQISGGPVSVAMAGDDVDAKNKVAELVNGIGLHAVDIGGLHYSRVLEGMLVIWMNARMSGKSYDYYLRPIRQ